MDKPVIRCSGLDRLLTCPGSRTLERRLNEIAMDFTFGLSGDAMTWRGNWCHWMSACQLVWNHGAIVDGELEKPAIPSTWSPQPWDERTVEWYVSNVVALTPPDHAIFVERRFTHEFPRFTLTGQLDVYTISPDGTEFTIDDNKTGPNEVDHAENNWQLAGYGALLKLKHPTLKRGKLRIFQREAEVQITEVEVDDLDILVEFIEGKINAALDSYLDLETAYKACRLCPCATAVTEIDGEARFFCPAYHEEVKRMKLTLTPEQVSALNVTTELRQLAEVAALGRAVVGPTERLLKTLKERIDAEGEVTLSDGSTVRVIEEDGRRSVTAPKVAHALLSSKIAAVTGSTPEDADDVAWKTLAMSISDVEDELVSTCGMQRSSKKTEKETAQSWIKGSLGHLITRSKVKKLKFS